MHLLYLIDTIYLEAIYFLPLSSCSMPHFPRPFLSVLVDFDWTLSSSVLENYFVFKTEKASYTFYARNAELEFYFSIS